MKIIVDCMSGDNAPDEIVKGALIGAEKENVTLILVGTKSEIEKSAKKCSMSLDGHEIVENTGENILMTDDPSVVTKEKSESSMAVSLKLLKEGAGEAVICAGSTGALFTGATLIIRRIKGVRRPALGAIIPVGSPALIADSGTNVVCTPDDLVMFARMGSIYMNKVMGIENPKVGLINNGEEECKGTDLQKETYQQLKNLDEINFTGNVEGREIFKGPCDVLVCDGFTGNIVLKMVEGGGKFVKTCLKKIFYRNIFSKLAYVLARSSVKALQREMDYSIYGGAPFLGIAKPVIKAHGSANNVSISVCIGQAKRYVESGMIDYIASLSTKSENKE